MCATGTLLLIDAKFRCGARLLSCWGNGPSVALAALDLTFSIAVFEVGWTQEA